MKGPKQIWHATAVLLTAGLLVVALSSSALINQSSGAVYEKPQLQEAPAIPAPVEPPPIIDGHGTGFIPPPMDLSHLKGRKMPEVFFAQESLPSIWDWREQGKVTPVKDQESCGSCYAFASIANIESEMLIDNAGTYDFSENNAKECNWEELNNFRYPTGNHWGSCDGGNYEMLANLFSQKGVVLESCDPYKDHNTVCTASCSYQKTLLDWRIISGDAVPDTNVLKEYIYATASPVYTSMYAGFPGFSNYDGSYTLNYTGMESPNHAVLIVGWNDSLPPTGGYGGWIVKNSWGPDWGDNGYFYITYDSANIGKYSSFMYDWQDYDPDGGLMYYDEAGGWWTAWGCNDTTAWGLCKFIPSSATYVTCIEFWTTDVTTDIDVHLYDDFDGTTLNNMLCSKLDLSFAEAGYHSVQLDSPLPVSTGNDIIAVVKFTNSDFKYPVAADSRNSYETGRTYISCTGENNTWIDLGANYQDDVAIRLRTTIPATITSCNSTGTEINFFALGESAYVKGSGLDANSDYKIWIQDDPVIGGDTLVDGENPITALTPKDVTTDASGNFGPKKIWGIPENAPITHHEYDIVVDKQDEGGNTGKLNFASDGIDSTTVAGIVAPVPELPTVILFSIGLLVFAGYVIVRRRYS